jgi:hypothetical protein
VGCVQTGKDIERDTVGDGQGEVAVGLQRAGDETRRGVAFDVLHDKVVTALTRADFDDRTNVWMMNARGQPGLVEEHLDEFRVLDEVGVQSFVGDQALKACDSAEPREEDGRHATARELGDELEAIEVVSCRYGLQPGQRRLLLEVTSRVAFLALACSGRPGSEATRDTKLSATRVEADGRSHPRAKQIRRIIARPLREEDAYDRSRER